MSIAEKLQAVAENQQRVYDAGFSAGQASGGDTDAAYNEGYTAGQQAEWDAFWEVFQQGGAEMTYQHAFSSGKFTDENYNPKYPLRFASNTSVGGQYVFYSSTITDTKVEIVTGLNRSTTSCFQYCRQLHTIRKLTVNSGNTFANTFDNCTALKNIVIEGVIGNDINFQWSPLSKESILSIMAALSDTASAKTVSFNQNAVNAAFTTDEWNALAAAKSNWTITLA